MEMPQKTGIPDALKTMRWRDRFIGVFLALKPVGFTARVTGCVLKL